ncbi:MAG: SurA N-terminal domain-containing protein [Rhodobacteraceae bacterium]|nr:SurA N-terminal domain-containing protein [Paracoccaceae bacterium]
MGAGAKTLSKTFVWLLLGLLIVGLAGFGVLSSGGTIRTVATVGNQTLSTNDYARELQRQIRAIEAQTGQPLQMEQAHNLGIDQSVLARLIALAALDSEVVDLGLSIGDENLQQEIVEISAFQGVNGAFDRESYQYQLERTNVTEAEFEADLRAEAARTIVQAAIIDGVVMPDALNDTITNFVAARRSFTHVRFDDTALTEPLADPTDQQLQMFYDDNANDFTLPQTKRLTYVLMTPAMMLDQIDIEEDALRKLYDDRSDKYNIPERRLVERLVFGNSATASEAMAQIEVGGTTFENLVLDRGLTLSDIDLGDVSIEDLGGAAEPIFAAEVGKVIGPLDTVLGPALFRVNGNLAAQITPFADARQELHEELASERARRLVDAQAENIDDLLAGGASLQELADETDMQLDTIDWTALSLEGVAAYARFRAAASAVTEDDFPAVAFLEDGAMFALQLNETLPQRPEPFDSARDRVIAAWELDQTKQALQVIAERVVTHYVTSGDFSTAGAVPISEVGLTRTAFLQGTPADFMNQVFEMDMGELRVIAGEGAVYVVRLDEELPPEETAELAALRERLGEDANQSLAQALFDAFVGDAQNRARPQVDQNAVNAVGANISGGGGGGGNPPHGQPGHIH